MKFLKDIIKRPDISKKNIIPKRIASSYIVGIITLLAVSLVLGLQTIGQVTEQARAEIPCGPTIEWISHYGMPGDTTDLGVSPDGNKVYAVAVNRGPDLSYDWDTRAYEAFTGEELWATRLNKPSSDFPSALAVSPDGIRIFVGGSIAGDFTIVTYHSVTGEELWTAPYSGLASLLAIVVSPDGSKVFATGTTRTADYITVAYDSVTGDNLWTVSYNGSGGYIDDATALDISQDGKIVFVTGRSFGVTGEFDYATVAYGTNTGAQLWVSRYYPMSESDTAVTIKASPDGNKIFVAGSSGGMGTSWDYATIAYDATTGAQIWASRYNGYLNSSDEVRALTISPDGAKVFATGSSVTADNTRDYVTIAYDANTGLQLLLNVYGDIATDDVALDIGINPDGVLVYVTGIVSTQENLLYWGTMSLDTVTGHKQWVVWYGGEQYPRSNAYPKSITINPNGQLVYITGLRDGDIDTLAYRSDIGPEDTCPPVTTILSAVDGYDTQVMDGDSTLSNKISLTFIGIDNDEITGFECTLDSGFFLPCSSPKDYFDLGAGAHIFKVRAIDASGNKDPAPPVWKWIVLTPQEAIEILINDLYVKFNDGNLNQGQEKSLIVKLDHVIEQLDRGNFIAATKQLQSFVDEVNALSDAGIFSQQERQGLIDAANRIIVRISE